MTNSIAFIENAKQYDYGKKMKKLSQFNLFFHMKIGTLPTPFVPLFITNLNH